MLRNLAHNNSNLDLIKTKEPTNMFSDTFKPLLNLLKVFGLYYDINKRGLLTSPCSVHRVYCVTVQLFLWVGFLRSLYPIRYKSEFGAELLLSLISIIWVSK